MERASIAQCSSVMSLIEYPKVRPLIGVVMALLDFVAAPRQRVAYLFPEMSELLGGEQISGQGADLRPAGMVSDLFVFQFWPSQVTDNYTPNYATKQIPGASHPLYQWVSGAGRDISFTANFVSEVREDSLTIQGATSNTSFSSRIAASGAGAITRGALALGAAFLPSSRYTVNVAGALASLQQYLYPSYNTQLASKGTTKPPKKLILVLPGTKLGRAEDADGVLCILKSANVTMESWFPSGELRAASVALQFAEIVQYTSSSVSNIRYIGSEAYTALANTYKNAYLSSPGDLSI
jgi:hypothetical protein